MNNHYSFGHSVETGCKTPGLGQVFGPLGLVLWAWFLHQSCAIMCLVSCPIVQTPIEPTQPKLWLSKQARLTSKPAGFTRQHTKSIF